MKTFENQPDIRAKEHNINWESSAVAINFFGSFYYDFFFPPSIALLTLAIRGT